MIFVQRDQTGRIVAVGQQADHASPPSGAGWEPVSDDDPGLAAFATQITLADPANPLVGTDLAMARVLEDLINLLIDQAVIRFTDLPPGAQAKLLARQNTRVAMSRLRLMGDADPENREVI
jgi:hypothetical protein